MMATRLFAFTLIVILIASLGCGKHSGVERHTISGTITYNGKPVPHGRIRFEPNRERGGTGPQGLAIITEGDYSTYDLGGMGVVSGPMKISIEGYPSKEPMIPLMFPIYRDTIDVSSENRVFDFDVPVSSKKKQEKK